MNPLLSIAIPTNSRLGILSDNLRDMLPELRETGVTVHISDSSNDDVTENGIGELQRAYPGGIFYRHNRGLLYDGNCLKALGMPTTPYVWYLADGLRILPGGIKRMLAAIEQTPCDFAVVSDTSRGAVDLPSGLHRDPILVLERLGWHMTLAGATVYAREHLEDLETRYAKYLGCNFIHLAIILEGMLRSSRGLLWMNERWMVAHLAKRSGWLDRVLEVFGKDWIDFILSLPDAYPRESKLLAIREHSFRTHVLEWKALGKMRRQGRFDLRTLRRHSRTLRLASNVPFPAIVAIAIAPPWLARLIAHLGYLAARVARARRWHTI